MSKLNDLTGQKVGRLTVICREGTYQRPSGNKEPTWRCKCECGNEVVVHSSNLKRKNTLSCGCLQAENRKVPRRETEYEIRGDVAYVKSFDGVEFVINTCDLDDVLKHRWHGNGHGYMADEHGNTIHRFLMKPPAVMDVHHINENKLDNRRINLLMLSRSEHTALHQRKDIANGVTFATDNNVGDKMTPTWIPVTERLPKLETYVYSVDVLFYVPYENIYVGYVNFESGTWKCKHSRELFAADKVTHWMPLSEPPKGE